MAERTNTCLNVNVGVLGHVDSGKTSLVEKLSTTFSTASLDKHPQSQERGITLDLGFSSFQVPFPGQIDNSAGYQSLQFTLVDCPGHASLIRTVLGGSHIMDLMILVIDITKGIQVQTAECIVIGEITVKKILVVLNKIDLIPTDTSKKTIEKAIKKVTKTLKLTTFGECKVIPVSAKTGEGVETIAVELTEMMDQMPERKTGDFLFAIDHCFRIKGQGTVLTGTALQGELHLQDPIEFPSLAEKRKVKGIQMFKKPVDHISAGDRAGLCVSNLDPTRIERGLAATPGSVHTCTAAIASIHKVRFFDASVKSRQKFHIMYGHSISVASCLFVIPVPDQNEYQFQEELLMDPNFHQSALIKFDTPLTAPMGLKLIGAKLDGGSDVLSCRLAFHGEIIQFLQTKDLDQIKIFKIKERKAFIKSLQDDKTALCGDLVENQADLEYFKGKEVAMKDGNLGHISQAHGKDGDFLVQFNNTIAIKSEDEKQITLFSKKYIS